MQSGEAFLYALICIYLLNAFEAQQDIRTLTHLFASWRPRLTVSLKITLFSVCIILCDAFLIFTRTSTLYKSEDYLVFVFYVIIK